MSSWCPGEEISVSDSEEEYDHVLKNVRGRECIIFIVDANLQKKPQLLENSLLILRSAFLSGLLVNDKDLIGLIFVNTEWSPEPCEQTCLENVFLPDKCAIFLPPHQLNAAIVEKFLKLVETAPTQFGEIYGALPDNISCNFSHVLRLCMDLVQYCNYLVNNTALVFLTDNELPHPSNSDCYRQVLQKAADLKGKDVEFHLVPMVDGFNYDAFYKEFICLIQDIDIDCFQPPNPKRIREMLVNRKFKQHYVRRSLGHFNFSLGSNLMLSAQYFNYYQKQKKPLKLLLQRTDSAVVRKHRITQLRKHDPDFNDTTEVRDVNIKNAWYEINLGCSSMRLTYQQVNRIRNIHSPGMVLLGFKPISFLNCAIYSKTANFMYPDDSHIVGSKRLFRALWEKCIEKQKIAICLFMCKRKSMPRYVALVATREDVDMSNENLVFENNGFKIIYLSCFSYIRNFNLNNWNSYENKAQDQDIKICEKIMKKFRLEYKSDILCDPNLDQLQSKLLGLAFNVNYETLGSQYFPNPQEQNLRISSILTNFKEIFGEELSCIPKRSLDHSSVTSERKKVKLQLDINNKNSVMEMVKSQNLSSCSKDQLIQILSEHFDTEVSKTKKKAELLELLYNL